MPGGQYPAFEHQCEEQAPAARKRGKQGCCGSKARPQPLAALEDKVMKTPTSDLHYGLYSHYRLLAPVLKWEDIS